MKKLLIIILCFVGAILFGCRDSYDPEPPIAIIEVGNNSYETTLGAYCWQSNGSTTCVDVPGPQKTMAGKERIEVNPGDKIKFVLDYEPEPNDFYVLEIDSGTQVEVIVEDNIFSAPMQQGVFYYSYGARWMDEIEENVSHASVEYHFVIKVE